MIKNASDIKFVIDTDPDAIGVSPLKSDVENSNLLNAVSASWKIVKPVSVADFHVYLINNRLITKIEDDSRNAASGTRGSSLSFVYFLMSGQEGFYLLEAVLSALLDGYVANSVVFGGFTVTDKTNFLNFVKRDASYAEFRWGAGTVVTDRDISVVYGRSYGNVS